MPRKVIIASAEILGGTPVFAGTRVPVETFIKYVKVGESIEYFLEGFSFRNQRTGARVFG
jgi:uncharacterized protein (DUF433 family)